MPDAVVGLQIFLVGFRGNLQNSYKIGFYFRPRIMEYVFGEGLACFYSPAIFLGYMAIQQLIS